MKANSRVTASPGDPATSVWGRAHLDRQYLAHYHLDRPHQGLGNQLITPMADAPNVNAEVECTETLGGMLRSYRRAA